MALFSRLALPTPWARAREPIPLIIYGGSSAVGSYAIKLASRADIHPLLVVAGSGASHVEKLIDRSKGDAIIDYRQGPESVISGIRNALKAAGLEKQGVKHAFDAISGHGSYQTLAQALDPYGKITLLLHGYDDTVFPSTMNHSRTGVGGIHLQHDHLPGDPDLGFVFCRLFGKGLQDGWYKGHPYEVRKGGLGGVQEALLDLKAGKNSATKYVFRIAETEGLKSEGNTETG
jgi:NADPH2:quinone reductase